MRERTHAFGRPGMHMSVSRGSFDVVEDKRDSHGCDEVWFSG